MAEPAGESTSLLMDQAVLNMARKWRLIRTDGTVKCINDRCDRDATLPTLECNECREWRRGR